MRIGSLMAWKTYSEKPEIGIVRKHRTNSGLIRYDPRRDTDWAQAAREDPSQRRSRNSSS